MASKRAGLFYFTLLYSFYKVTASIDMAVVKIVTTFYCKIISNISERILRYTHITDLNNFTIVRYVKCAINFRCYSQKNRLSK